MNFMVLESAAQNALLKFEFQANTIGLSHERYKGWSLERRMGLLKMLKMLFSDKKS